MIVIVLGSLGPVDAHGVREDILGDTSLVVGGAPSDTREGTSKDVTAPRVARNTSNH